MFCFNIFQRFVLGIITYQDVFTILTFLNSFTQQAKLRKIEKRINSQIKNLWSGRRWIRAFLAKQVPNGLPFQS